MKQTLKDTFKRLLPPGLIAYYRIMRLNSYRKHNSAIPVKEVFTRIYRNNEWGGAPGEFRSGSGSTEEFISSYVETVTAFIRDNSIKRVIDLGCGDFVVGSKLQVEGATYLGIDIVDDLIQRNQASFGTEHISFRSLDIISEALPQGDLCLIRQVLQHLSNTEIQAVLRKLPQYRFVIITEHYPAPTVRVTANKDKPHGGDTRIVDNSAVYLDCDPFNMGISRLLLEVETKPIVADGETIRSYLLEHPPSNSEA